MDLSVGGEQKTVLITPMVKYDSARSISASVLWYRNALRSCRQASFCWHAGSSAINWLICDGGRFSMVEQGKCLTWWRWTMTNKRPLFIDLVWRKPMWLSQDEREGGISCYFKFGHTFGHAMKRNGVRNWAARRSCRVGSGVGDCLSMRDKDWEFNGARCQPFVALFSGHLRIAAENMTVDCFIRRGRWIKTY